MIQLWLHMRAWVAMTVTNPGTNFFFMKAPNFSITPFFSPCSRVIHSDYVSSGLLHSRSNSIRVIYMSRSLLFDKAHRVLWQVVSSTYCKNDWALSSFSSLHWTCFVFLTATGKRERDARAIVKLPWCSRRRQFLQCYEWWVESISSIRVKCWDDRKYSSFSRVSGEKICRYWQWYFLYYYMKDRSLIILYKFKVSCTECYQTTLKNLLLRLWIWIIEP